MILIYAVSAINGTMSKPRTMCKGHLADVMGRVGGPRSLGHIVGHPHTSVWDMGVPWVGSECRESE